MVLPRKISFHGGIKRDVLFAEVVVCYTCKTRHMLGENCPVVSPTPEDSSMSYSEQSKTVHESPDPAHPEPSVEIPPQGESQCDSLLPAEEVRHETSSREETDSDSDSESGAESTSSDESASESPVESALPLKESAELPSQKSLPVAQTAQPNTEPASPPHESRSNLPLKENPKENQASSSESKNKRSVRKKSKTLKSLRNFPYDPIFKRWYRNENTNIFPGVLDDLGVKKDKTKIVALLAYAAELIDLKDTDRFTYILKENYSLYLHFEHNKKRPSPTLEQYEDYLYTWPEKVWSTALKKFTIDLIVVLL